MHGRMIHGRDKTTNEIFEESQLYDVHGRVCRPVKSIPSNHTDGNQFIRAADRAGLNKRLLDELEIMPNVNLHFNHDLQHKVRRERRQALPQSRLLFLVILILALLQELILTGVDSYISSNSEAMS